MSQVIFLRVRIFLLSEPFFSSWVCCGPVANKQMALKGYRLLASGLLDFQTSVVKAVHGKNWDEATRAAYQSEENNT